MKNAMLIGVVSLSMILTACNGGGGSDAAVSSNAQTVGTSGVRTTALIQTNGCSASAQAGGALIQCGDGSSATVSNGAAGAAGAAGATGAQGPQGPQGIQGVAGTNAPVTKVADRNGVFIGTDLVSWVPIAAGNGGTLTVHDSTDGVTASWDMSTGNLYRIQLYYSAASCSGIGYAHPATPVNHVAQNGLNVVRVVNTITQFTPQSYKDVNGNCFNTVQSTAYYAQTAAFSSSLIPATISLPVQFQ